jgi:hypothetical protein
LARQGVAVGRVGARFYPSALYVVGEEETRKRTNSLLDYAQGISRFT